MKMKTHQPEGIFRIFAAVVFFAATAAMAAEGVLEFPLPMDGCFSSFDWTRAFRYTGCCSTGNRSWATPGSALSLKDAPPLDRDFRILDQRRTDHDKTWKPAYGERSEIRDHYRQVEIDLADSRQPPRRVTLRVRAYDEGVALCYHFP